MILRTDFKMNLVANVVGRSSVTLTISVLNQSPNDFYVSQGSIWGAPFHGTLPFSITGPSNIPCYPFPTFHNSGHGCLKIETEKHLSGTVDISNLCVFQNALPGEYVVHGYSNFILYNLAEECIQGLNSNPKEYVNLGAEANFTIPENENEVRNSGELSAVSNSLHEEL